MPAGALHTRVSERNLSRHNRIGVALYLNRELTSRLVHSLGLPVIIVQVRSHSPDSGSFQFFPESGKGERASVFHGDRERQLRFCRFTPFVESVRRNQASPSF